MRIILHPLFVLSIAAGFAVGLGFFVFAAVAAVLIHEASHAAAARLFGVRAKELRLLPFGAQVDIDCAFLRVRERILILLAGSFGNIIAVLVAGSFLWLFPNLFMVFEIFIVANAVPAFLNLLPVYPLDGGKVLHLLLGQKWTKALQFFSNGIFGVLFLFGCFMSFNLPLLILSGMMLVMINIEIKQSSFVSKFAKSVLCKTNKVTEVAVRSEMTLFQVYKNISEKHYTRFIIIDRENKEFYENQLEEWLLSNSFGTRLGAVV